MAFGTQQVHLVISKSIPQSPTGYGVTVRVTLRFAGGMRARFHARLRRCTISTQTTTVMSAGTEAVAAVQ